MADMRVDLKPGTLNGIEIRKFTVEKNSLENLRLALHGGRQCVPGEYTMLRRNGRLWMSDTTAEQADHWEVASVIRRRGGRILIGGLGLGMIVREALRYENVTHIDVVEIDPDVAELVGSQYDDPRVTIHVADMYEIEWPPGTRWQVAWFDIWPDLSEDNLPEMARLARSYGRRAVWKGYWGKDVLLRERARRGGEWW